MWPILIDVEHVNPDAISHFHGVGPKTKITFVDGSQVTVSVPQSEVVNLILAHHLDQIKVHRRGW